MQLKSFPFDVKADTEKRTFEGYASVFGNVDAYGEVVDHGAFTKTVAERLPKRLIKILWQHFDPLGMPQSMHEDSHGLYVVGKVSKTQLGDEALTLMQDGVVDRMSIGYSVIKEEFDHEAKTTHLKELKLYEFSPVTFPANEEAVITALKSAEIRTLLKRVPGLAETNGIERADIEGAIKALTALLARMEPGQPTPTEQEPRTHGFDPEQFQSILGDLSEVRRSIGAIHNGTAGTV